MHNTGIYTPVLADIITLLQDYEKRSAYFFV